MKDYTKNIHYIKTNISKTEGIYLKHKDVDKIDPEHPSYLDQKGIFNHSKYKYPYTPLHIGKLEIKGVESINKNVLRMMIRKNNENEKIYIPPEFDILKDFILDSINYHRQHYIENKDCFIYLTVRQSTYEDIFYNDATTWHVDGFQSGRIGIDIVEQNIIWCNKMPTKFSIQPFYIENLNSMKHNVHDYFQKHAKEELSFNAKENNVYLMTPYNVHKVDKVPFEDKRVFVRINFSPVEIEDYTNTVNPSLVYEYPERIDIRNEMIEYTETEESNFS